MFRYGKDVSNDYSDIVNVLHGFKAEMKMTYLIFHCKVFIFEIVTVIVGDTIFIYVDNKNKFFVHNSIYIT